MHFSLSTKSLGVVIALYPALRKDYFLQLLFWISIYKEIIKQIQVNVQLYHFCDD